MCIHCIVDLLLYSYVFFFILIGQNDPNTLKQLYSKVYGFKNYRGLSVNKELERLAQSHGCVTDHSQHKSTDAAALRLSSNANNGYGNIEYIIECAGSPCPRGHDQGSVWEDYRYQTEHYNAILRNNVIGCASINAGSGRRCNFCYLYSA